MYLIFADGGAVVSVDPAIVADTAWWIDKGTDCTLSGGSSSPYFVPKVTSVWLEYDELLSSTFGKQLLFSLFFIV
jgi:hypothetical protein